MITFERVSETQLRIDRKPEDSLLAQVDATIGVACWMIMVLCECVAKANVSQSVL